MQNNDLSENSLLLINENSDFLQDISYVKL